ncbi:MAG: chlorophyll synthase ChlG [Pseudomonadota bacterium]
MTVNHDIQPPALPDPLAVLELLKPITWFAPMWAFGCGVISTGMLRGEQWPLVVLGLVLAGPLVCAMSQAANDWFDRHVDAINEPERPIPSGRIPGRWGLWIALGWSVLSLSVASLLGPWGLGAATVAMACAWAYSAPPVRLKRNGWLSAAACGLCYEGLPWFTGAAVIGGALPASPILLIALLYSIGAHGIMTLNDFKSIEGDRATGIASLPATLGPDRAARIACIVMALPQVLVIALLFGWGQPWHSGVVALLLAMQVHLMGRLLIDPRARAPWYNATGTGLYVLGMLAASLALAAMMGKDAVISTGAGA